ncbi:helix-turn-helix domain-containing protein [Listeria monocytogenes]|nr:helix-turn-helix domain-containing protein [Listeria monocytogenes]EII7458018.1 helix-turn-helix domain-containing protein [Listeria monocytogenes]EIN9163115.1 helix-turn-helix domain-containing protein [Listeria monocytogenes]EIT8968814.1 helix-turn-helix domain-containing protein [Listeria monocytogenes]HDU3287635.1 helix-turn-helix domain-containing protein [Listeria monocytogenes]
MSNNLKELRGERSKASVARSLGITPQHLGYIEDGSRNPSLTLMFNIAKLYNRKVDEIFFDRNVTKSYKGN